MLFLLGQYGELFQPLNLFRYITFRTGGATITALVFVFLFGPLIISCRARTASRSAPTARRTSTSAARPPWAG
jgi:phospho-N-acetylmuramoyl-pentapeptide-transferase